MSKIAYRPTTDKVLMEEIPEEISSVLIMPDNSQPEIVKAKVVAVGPGRETYQGLRPLQVKVDDIVYIPRMTAIEIKLDGAKYLLCSEDRIFCVGNPEMFLAE